MPSPSAHQTKSRQQTGIRSPEEISIHPALSQDASLISESHGPGAGFDSFMSPGIPSLPDLQGNDLVGDGFQNRWPSNSSVFSGEKGIPWPLSKLQDDGFSQGLDSDAPGESPSCIAPASLTLRNVQTVQQDLGSVSPSLIGDGMFDTAPTVPTEPSGWNTPIGHANSHSSLPRRRSRYLIRRSGHKVNPVFIPNMSDTLDPMQRWQESPPEDEPASMSAIMNALSSPDRKRYKDSGSEGQSAQYQDLFRDHRRPVSLASSSSGTSVSSKQSATSARSASSAMPVDRSTGHSRLIHGRVRKSRRETKGPDATNKPRIFCCTFCCDRFKTRYDWVRHEKSLHLILESWLCAPHGGAPISPVAGRKHCAYCHCLDPSTEHLQQHNHQACSDGTRAFRRKDHLVQHLQLMHRLETVPLIDDWKTPISTVASRCGFCDRHLSSWDERIEHLAFHFRKGSTMGDWQGDHEFPPSIAAKVTNALPPYLIGSESKTMVPFSATNCNVKDHFAQISKRADQIDDEEAGQQGEETLASSFQQLRAREAPLSTFTEVLTLHLGRYARQQMSLGVLPTDEMFQQESRRLLYDSEDTWNQTIADNPEWLSAFRRHLQQPGNGGFPGEDNSAARPGDLSQDY